MNILRSLAGLLVFGAFSFAQADPVDLSDWTAEGAGNWVLQPGNDSVLQTLNETPTVFHNGIDSQGLQLSGTIQVNTTEDDDFVGFVLGYSAGDLFNSDPNYLVIDWRQSGQQFGRCFAQAGLSAMQVTSATSSILPNGSINPSFFGNTACRDGAGVDELARGLTLGATGWDDFVEYSFDLIFTETIVQVLVNGNLELNLTGTFSNGAFGFYNSSQENVLYAGIIQDDAVIVPVPEPGTLALLSIGLASLGWVRRRRKV